MENIVLIGMPGCGKSTIGRILADKLNRKFIDADLEIEKYAGCPIPQIFQQGGEQQFRKIETKVLADLGKQSGLVIATGGGCVTQAQNKPLLQQNGQIIWMERAIEDLPTDGRPLSQAANLTQMYAVRKPMYEAFADVRICNDASAEETANKIINALNREMDL